MSLTPAITPWHPAPLDGRVVLVTGVFLRSPQSGFITGESFVADGGMTRKMQYR